MKKLIKYSSFSFKLLKRGNSYRNLNSLFSFKKFCTLSKLNVDKLNLEKLEFDDKSINLQKEDKKEYNKDDYILEFSPALNWEETVLKSEIPVIVDFYAVYINNLFL